MESELPLPASLGWMVGDDRASAWLGRLGGLVARALDRWPGRLGAPYEGGVTSWVAPLDRDDGTRVVLKIQYPDRETRHEATALRVWDGSGAVRLLDHHVDDGALLLERCEPGHPLSRAEPEEAVATLGELVIRLAVPAGAPFTDVADEAARWADSLDRARLEWPGALDERLAAAVREFLDELQTSRRHDRVLVHQDMHADNVLAAEREPWLIIDPKPLAADLAFAAAPVVRSAELGHSRSAVLRRLHHLSELLGVDRRDAARRTVAQTVAWGFTTDGPITTHLDVARWVLPETG